MNLINYLPTLILKIASLDSSPELRMTVSIFLISCAVFLALSLLLFFFLTFFSRNDGGWIPDQVRNDKKRSDLPAQAGLQDRAYLQAFSIIQEAKRDALKVIKDSNLRAQSIIKEAHVINKKSENLLEGEIEKAAEIHIRALEKTSDELLNFYKEMVEKEQENSLDTFKKASDSIQTAVIKDVDELKETLHNETLEARQKVEKEMEEYRSRRMQEIDKKIYDIVYEVTAKVLGKSLSIADHEAVIFKILDDVKQKGGLSANNTP